MAGKNYEIPDECRYTQSDEWVRIDADVAFIGITDYAQSELSDIVYVELPDSGTQLELGQNFGVVESVKAVGDLYAPLAGEVVRVNKALEETPELVNEDPYGRGWIIALAPEDLDAFDELMSPADYKAHIEARSRS
jgi:glycine cleavage system H protein